MDWVIAVFVGSGCCAGLKEDCIFFIFGFLTLEGCQAEGAQQGPVLVGTFFTGRRCSLWGWRKGVPGGGAFHHCEGRLGSGAVPPPTARPPAGWAVGVRHPRAVGAGVWVLGPNTVPLAWMPRWGCVPRGWLGAVPGGGGLPPL